MSYRMTFFGGGRSCMYVARVVFFVLFPAHMILPQWLQILTTGNEYAAAKVYYRRAPPDDVYDLQRLFSPP